MPISVERKSFSSLAWPPFFNVFLIDCSPSRGRSGMRSGWGGEIGGTGVDHYGNPGTAYDTSLVPLSRSMSSLSDEKKEAPIDTVKWVSTYVSYCPWTLCHNVQAFNSHFVFRISVLFFNWIPIHLSTYIEACPLLNLYSTCIQICYLYFLFLTLFIVM